MRWFLVRNAWPFIFKRYQQATAAFLHAPSCCSAIGHVLKCVLEEIAQCHREKFQIGAEGGLMQRGIQNDPELVRWRGGGRRGDLKHLGEPDVVVPVGSRAS